MCKEKETNYISLVTYLYGTASSATLNWSCLFEKLPITICSTTHPLLHTYYFIMRMFPLIYHSLIISSCMYTVPVYMHEYSTWLLPLQQNMNTFVHTVIQSQSRALKKKILFLLTVYGSWFSLWFSWHKFAHKIFFFFCMGGISTTRCMNSDRTSSIEMANLSGSSGKVLGSYYVTIPQLSKWLVLLTLNYWEKFREKRMDFIQN